MNESKFDRVTVPSRFGRRIAAMALTIVTASTQAAEPTPSWPTPGDYQIDTDTTTTSKAAPTSVERRQFFDGATGQIKIVMRDTLTGSQAATQTYPGTGPNKCCVRTATAAPPAGAGASCGTPAAASSANFRAMTRCGGAMPALGRVWGGSSGVAMNAWNFPSEQIL